MSRRLASAAANNLFVGNLPWTVSKKELTNYFAQFGDIAHCKVLFDQKTGFSKSYGFVRFFDKESSDAALAKEHHLEGSLLTIEKTNARERGNFEN